LDHAWRPALTSSCSPDSRWLQDLRPLQNTSPCSLDRTTAVFIMNSPYFALNGDDDYKKRIVGGPKDTVFQIVISAILGIAAFLAFCVSASDYCRYSTLTSALKILRPRWPGLYAARKKQKDEAYSLPDLPSTLFGWIPTLWRITDQQVLASAGLDAYVVCSPTYPLAQHY
jgi:Late exocytosis, associated with Golgi transport